MQGRRKTDLPIVDAIYTEVDGEIQRVYVPTVKPTVRAIAPVVDSQSKSDETLELFRVISLGLLGLFGLAILWSML